MLDNLNHRLRDALVAVSIANITLVTTWEDLAASRFFLIGPAAIGAVVGAVLNLIWIAALVYGVLRVVRRMPDSRAREARGLIMLLALAIPADWLRRQLGGPTFSSVAADPGYSLPIVVGAFVLLAVPAVRRRLASAVEVFLICIVPAVALSLFQAGMSLRSYPALPAPAAQARKPAALRTVLMVFDELDQRTAFVDRPQGVELPALDDLARRSVVADNAYASYGGTIQAIPSLLTGEPIETLGIYGTDLVIRPQGHAQVRWSERPGVFGWAHDRGYESSIVGWYLPYCGVFGQLVARCSSGTTLPEERDDLRVADAMVIQLRRALEKAPMMDRLGVAELMYLERHRRVDRIRHVETYERVRHDALEEVANPARDFVFVHWPAPHAPHVYDAASGQFNTGHDGTYAQSLALVDRSVAEVQRALAASGLADRTAILITADHWWRRAPRIDKRVPLMIHMPQADKEESFTPAVHSRAAVDVAKALLAGDVRDAPGVIELLSRLAAGFRGPGEGQR